MDLVAEAKLPFPRPVVFAAYRDKLVDLLPYLPNVRSIEIKSRKDDGTITQFVNVWHGGGEIPAAARAVLSENMLSWTDHAKWDESKWTCEWRIETHSFSEAVSCQGVNTFTEEDGGTKLSIRGQLVIDAKKIRGVPGLLAGKVGRTIEEFLGNKIRPNLVEVSAGLRRYLDEHKTGLAARTTMPWIRAKLRDSVVFARADEGGELVVEGGTVEVRYKANDGRMYRARAQNLVRVPGDVLPDSACGEAAPVEKKEKSADAGGAGSAPAKTGRPGRMPTKAAAMRAGTAAVPDGAVVAYTDGACSGNPGPAGLGVVVVDGDRQIEISEYLGSATNNVAELTALLRGMTAVDDPDRVIVLHTDSQYAIGVLSKGWKAKANQALIADIKAELGKRKHVRLVYVPGHSGVPLNEHADQLARLAVSTRSSSKHVRTKHKPATT